MEGSEARPLEQKLEQATASLKANLDEACTADVQHLDTGEAIRIEEVLALASEAAREVVSLRRRQRQDARQHASEESAETTIGAHRQFVDERGVSWDAFAVQPTIDTRSLSRLPAPYQHGWLCFESGTEKRRLGPIPEGWQTVSDDELRRLRDAAPVVPPRAARPASSDAFIQGSSPDGP